jgi:hypothetical protein
MLAARLPASAGTADMPTLKPVDEQAAYFGDVKDRTIQPAAGVKEPATPTVWLPDARVARAWQAVVTGKPFESQ